MSNEVVPAAKESAAIRKHHRYGPSRLNYIDDCAAFASQAGTSEAAEEGTFLHDIMEKVILQVVKGRAKTTLEQIGGWVTKSFEIEEDQLSYLRFCCRKVDAFFAKKPTAVHTEISIRVTHPDGSELNHGFLDVLFVFGDVGILIDFKFGWEPVRPAKDNLQGMNYVLGAFQKFAHLNRIGVCFVQPKLNWITEAVFERRAMSSIFNRLGQVIERAEYVQKHPEDAQRYMAVGHYCKYCALQGSCAVLANHRAIAAAKYSMLPVPPSFKGLELTKPEDLALARYWAEVIETGLSEVKQRAFEVAKENGGEISCTLPNGEKVTYEVRSRSAKRVLGAAPEVAEALKDICTPEEVLGAADLAITKLEPIVKQAMVDLAAARGEKLTKKAAWEQAESLLEAHGVLSKPDTTIEFLQQKREIKQINETNK